MSDIVRLTQMVSSAGCAAKIFPYILSDSLKDINWYSDDDVLVGFSGSDDAGIYKISDETALIHTTDFFTPVVDDPYIFGMIAICNSLSDIYAMGGSPLNALNIVAFPQKEDINILKEILRGGNDKAKEAKCPIIGGHSVDIPNILYGAAITGKINIQDIKRNDSAKPDEVLILTKSLGTGLLNNVIKYSKLNDNIYSKLISSMCRLNKYSSELMVKYNASGCTDITGFGLAGHSMQLAKASGIVMNFSVKNIPVLEGAIEAIENNYLTRGDKSNRIYTSEYVINKGNVDIKMEHILYDPQTSGGLLISVPEKFAKDLLEELINSGEETASIIGYTSKPLKDEQPGLLVFNY